MHIGAHVSIAGGIHKAPKRAHETGCECLQIFSRSPRGGKAPPLTEEVVRGFKEECENHGIRNSYIHVPYYINLASEKKELWENSASIIAEDLQRGTELGVHSVVFHPGSARDGSREEAVERVVEGVRHIVESAEFTPYLLIENTAGQGTIIGDTFEELALILNRVEHPNVGICLDTAHLLASGYDIRTIEAFDEVLDHFDTVVGLEKLKLFHANDSKVGLGERKDRHEHIGRGKIGLEGFRALVTAERLRGIDVVVETTPDGLAEDVSTLKGLREEGRGG